MASRATRIVLLTLPLACAKPSVPSVAAIDEAPPHERTPAASEPVPTAEPRTSLFERAPADVFAIARVRGAPLRAALEGVDAEMRADWPTLATCNVELASITLGEAVATNGGAVSIELQADFGVTSVACALGMQADEHGYLRLGDVTLAPIPGGLSVRYRGTDGPTAPIPADLATKLGRTDEAMMVANLGEGARRMTIELDVTATEGSGRLHFADASRADAMLAWLARSRDRLDAERRTRLETLRLERTEDGIRFALSEDPTTMVTIAQILRGMAEAFAIPSTSMLPALEPRDQMLVDRLVRTDELTRGDVVVFRPPDHPSEKFVKRIVGLPGDRLRFVGGAVEIRGKKVVHGPAKETFASLGLRSEQPRGFELTSERIGDREYTILHRKGPAKPSEWFVVPKGHFFAVGDNRMQSHDSREFGPVPLAAIHGRAAFVWLSLHEGAINQQRSGITVR